MKYKKLLIAFLIFSQAGFTYAEVNKDAWEQGLAVLAQNININSLKSKPALVEKLKKMPKHFSVNDVKVIVSDYRLNLDICNSIQNLAGMYKDFPSEESAKNFLSEDIFDGQLKSFAGKRQQKELDELKNNIKYDLNGIANWNTPKKTGNNENKATVVDEKPSPVPTEVIAGNPQNDINNNSQNDINNNPQNDINNNPQSSISLQDRGAKTFNWVSFQLNIVSLLLLVGIACFLWIFLKKEIDNRYRKIKQKLDFIDETKANQVALKKLDDKINALNHQLKKLGIKPIENAPKVPADQSDISETLQKKQLEEPSKPDISEPLQKKQIEEPSKPDISEPLQKKQIEEPSKPDIHTDYFSTLIKSTE